MTKKTQIEWVYKQLKKYGKITRNQCLKNYISRLGAIIYKLKKEGFNFDAGYTIKGHDYIYYLKK